MSTRALQIEILANSFVNPSTGLPVNAGTAYFYAAGTTTAKAVYTEKEKANAYTSYTLDANGGALLYGEGNYKIVIKNSEGSIVDTIYNYRVEFPNYYSHTIIADHSQVTEDDFLFVNTTSGSVTINLLDAASWIRPLKVMRITGANSVIIEPYGAQTINVGGTAETNYTLSISNHTIEISSDGSNLVLTGISSGQSDNDGDTQIIFDSVLDDDVIRFNTAGVERATIDSNGLNITSGKAVSYGAIKITDSAVNTLAAIFSGPTTKVFAFQGELHAPATTIMLFGQNSAPTGWTRKTDWQDNAMLCYAASGNIGSGGAVDPQTTHTHTGPSHTHDLSSHTHTVLDHTHTTASHALTILEMPAHTHSIVTAQDLLAGLSGPGSGWSTVAGATSGSAGSGDGHAHGDTGSAGSTSGVPSNNTSGASGTGATAANTAPYYQEVIAATKDAY